MKLMLGVPVALAAAGMICACAGQPASAPTTTAAAVSPPGGRLDAKIAAEIAAVAKQHDDPRVWFVPATATPPVIDGKIDEPAWKKSQAHRFTWLVKKSDTPPTDVTDAWMLCDAENFYVAFRCQADVSKLRGSKPPKGLDGVKFSNDYVEIILDPEHSRKKCFQFVVECHGTFSDVIYHPTFTATGGNWGEEIKWTSQGVATAVSADEKAWYVEARIPFKTLVLEPGKDAFGPVRRIWGISLNRMSQATKEDTAIGHTARTASARPVAFGRAIIEVGKEPGKRQ